MRIRAKKKTLAVLIAAAFSGVSASVIAEENTAAPVAESEKTESKAESGETKASLEGIETVVVVGKATNFDVTSDEMKAYQANTLSDIFRHEPSVSVGGGANGIAQKIYIRGLEDAMLNVTIDGAPQRSTLFHHIGRVTIDPDLLESVEVQAGAGEATAGAGAIGGAIRFKTKDVNDFLAPDERIGGTLKVGTYSNDGDQKSLSVYGRFTDNWGLLGYTNKIERENAEDGDGKELDGTGADQQIDFVKLSGEISDNQRLSVSYEQRQEEGEFNRWPNWSPADGAPVVLYDSKGERETFIANYQINTNDFLNMEVTAYQTESAFQRDFYTWRAEITSTGFDIRNTSYWGINEFTYGVEMREHRVESGTIDEKPDYGEKGSVLGLYFQGHTQVIDGLLLSYGVRSDDYEYQQTEVNYLGSPKADLDSSDISINAGVAYTFADFWTASLGYAEAARGKEIGDGFTVDGSTVDPDLKSETVENIEAAIEFNGYDVHAKLAVFQSTINDVIADQSGQGVYYENIGAVVSEGYELELAYSITDQINFYAGYASIDSVLEPANGLFTEDYDEVTLEAYEYGGLGNSRGDTLNIGVDYLPMSNLRLGWNMTNVQGEDNIETLQRAVELGWIAETQEIDKPGYTVHDIYAEWTAHDYITFNLAVLNLFDKTYLDHSSVGDYTDISGWENVRGYNEPGRNIRLSATVRF
jgi:hemoglobin/transferrin/lactoferrin receptor protein